MKEFATPQYITGEEIKEIRKSLGLTQKEFAAVINSSKPTVERWEASDGKITGPIVLLAQLLAEQPELVKEMELPPKEFPLRLKYMHNQKLCTLIDVDEARQKLRVVNYNNNILFRAFGSKEEPTFEDYKEFLESRCFPESRDKMKLVLKELNLPFYDPMLIIEKTKGRMAEDHFWIEIVR